MIHPLIKVLVSRPDLLAQHVAGYGQLVAAQASEATAQLAVRAALSAGAAVTAALGLGLGGVALLLFAAVPLVQMPYPWLLAVVPATPLVAAVGCVLAMRQRPVSWSMSVLRDQMAADAALLREASPS